MISATSDRSEAEAMSGIDR